MDLTGLVLTGFDINARSDNAEDEGETPVLQPIGAGGGGVAGDKPKFVKEIIERLNSLFGEATPIRIRWLSLIRFQRLPVKAMSSWLRWKVNTREQAMKATSPVRFSKRWFVFVQSSEAGNPGAQV